MTVYEFCWYAALLIGGATSASLLKGARCGAAPIAALAFAYGVKVQHRLIFLPWNEAVLVGPSEWFSPGHSLPLGLAFAVGAGTVWAALLGRPWRRTGDALAVGMMVTSALGRVGCIASGCCTGALCTAGFCVTHGAGSVAHSWQVAEGWLAAGAPTSLPVHPLATYFSLASLALLAVMAHMLRRRVQDGAVLTLWLVADPLIRLALEQLRGGMPERSATISATLEFWVVGSVAALLIAWSTRFLPRSAWQTDGALRRSRRVAARIALVGVVALPASAPAERTCDRTCWDRAFQDYLRDPDKGREEFLALARFRSADVPTVYLLALADARLRTGRSKEAKELFAEVAAIEPAGAWTDLAHLGAGFAAVRRGELEEARLHLEAVADSPRPQRHMASVLVATVDALEGDPNASAARFEAMMDDPALPESLRGMVARGRALSDYWAGRYFDAALRLDEAAEATSDPRQAGMIRYAAAVARMRAGDVTTARAALERLAATEDDPPTTKRVPTAADLYLEPAALIASRFSRYRSGPVGIPAPEFLVEREWPSGLLARAMLASNGTRWPSMVGTQRPNSNERTSSSSNTTVSQSDDAPTGPLPAATSTREHLPAGMLGALALLGFLYWVGRARGGSAS